MRYLFVVIILAVFTNLSFAESIPKIETEKSPLNDWSFMIYRGRTAQTIFLKLHRLQDERFTDTSIFAGEASKKVGTLFTTHMKVEWGFNYAHRFEHTPYRDVDEIATYLTLRWTLFPWSKWIYTSYAFSEGLSYATRPPSIEWRDKENNRGGTSNLLNYLGSELSVGLANHPEWTIVYRLHHRSGIFGLIDGVHGGSNVTAWGVRYTFLQ